MTNETPRTLAAIRREIVATWPTTVKRARVRPEALRALPLNPTLLGSSHKVELGEGLGYLTAVVYMEPATGAFLPGDGRTLCPFATVDCETTCLGTHAGRMASDSMRAPRLWKAALFLGARGLFMELLRTEVRAHARKAERLGKVAVVRFDGSTDTGTGAELMLLGIPGLQVYDYTKVPRRAAGAARGPGQYDVTFSRSGTNDAECVRVLKEGGRVAVVFDTARGAELPATWEGFPVVDGDEHDLCFLRPAGVVLGLRFKAAARRAEAIETAGAFVVRVTEERKAA